MPLLDKLLGKAEKWAVKHHKAPNNYDESKLKTLNQIADSITCGSVLLCSGTAAESRLIEELDGTDFSHVAMIVRFHNSPKLYLWTADTVKSMDDNIPHNDPNWQPKHTGTHLLDLHDYVASLDDLYPSADDSKYRFAVARLNSNNINEKKLWEVLYKYDGTPFPATEKEFLHAIEGVFNKNCGMKNSYCAQMLANTYQKMGWLSKKHPANYFNPGSFAKTKKINKELINGAYLTEPEYFKL